MIEPFGCDVAIKLATFCGYNTLLLLGWGIILGLGLLVVGLIKFRKSSKFRKISSSIRGV